MTEKKSFLDKVLDLFFDKTRRMVFLFFILGFVLRLIAARNLGVSPDDSAQALSPLGIFQSGKLVIWPQSTVLWYYIEGIFYEIFGLSTVVSRITTVIFGSFLVILMYVFVKEVFKSEKVALIASFIIAVSPPLIKQTLPEMDVAVSFFLIFGSLFLFRYFDSKSKKDLIFSALIIGVGVMIKLYVILFAVSFILLIMINEYSRGVKVKKIIKNVFIFGIIISILVVPTLTHNYLLYKDKGFMDYIFTNMLDIGREKSHEHYYWCEDWEKPGDYIGFFFGHQQDFADNPLPGFMVIFIRFFRSTPLMFFFGYIGLIFSYKWHRKYFWHFLVVFLPTFIFLSANVPLEKHMLWTFVLVTPVASNLIYKITTKFKKIKLKYILTVILIFNLVYLGMGQAYSLGAPFYGKSSIGQLITFKENEVPRDALVIFDGRIFRGTMHWAFAERNYIEATHFFGLAEQVNQAGNLQNIETYYVECVVDDCGWGTIAGQPEFNASMEGITAFFSNASTFKKDFEAPTLEDFHFLFTGERETRYRIYKTNLQLNPQILQIVRKTHTRYLLPEAYDRSIHPIFDDYEVRGFVDNTINSIAWFILYFELVFAYFLLFFTFYLFIDDKKDERPPDIEKEWRNVLEEPKV